MKALRYLQWGGPEVLQCDDLPMPPVAQGQVRLRVSLAAFNFADTERRRGLYARELAPPQVLGSECVGVVEAVGDGVSGLAVGDRVVALTRDSQAQFCVAEARAVTPLPAGVSDVAATQFIKALTAWHVLFTAGRTASESPTVPSLAGQWVGVTAASGGVGLHLVQLAKLAGAQVWALTSTPHVARAHGAEVATNVAPFTAGAEAVPPLSVLCDSVGAAVQPWAVKTLAPFGRWVSFGEASGPLAPLLPETLFEKSLTFSSWWLRSEMKSQVKSAAVMGVLSLLAAGRLRLETRVLSFAQAQQAHRQVDERQATCAMAFDPWA